MNPPRARFQIEEASSFKSRLVGLLGREELRSDQALWIEPCRAIHTWGMKFPIDLVFIDRDGRIERIDERVRPWRCRWCRRAAAVVELAAGAAGRAGLTVGQAWIH